MFSLKSFVFSTIVAAAFAAISKHNTPPAWADRFKVDFAEYRWPSPIQAKGSIYYDYAHTPRRIRLDRDNSATDPICADSRESSTLSSKPCTQLLIDDRLFVIHPTDRKCCFCCDKEHGCKVPPPEWLKNSQVQEKTYQAENGVTYEAEKWRMIGFPSNVSYTFDTELRFPLVLEQIGDQMVFQANTYLEGQWAVARSELTEAIMANQKNNLWSLPEYCSAAADLPSCGSASLCPLIQRGMTLGRGDQVSSKEKQNIFTIVSGVMLDRNPVMAKGAGINFKPSASQAERGPLLRSQHGLSVTQQLQ